MFFFFLFRCNGRLSCSIDLPTILPKLPQNCLDCTTGKYPTSLGLQVEYKCVSNILGCKYFRLANKNILMLLI
jgi:hypothetical protein